MGARMRAESEAARTVAVVLNWNSWTDTIACVESLLQARRVPSAIVICDNGSIDDSIERLRAWAETHGAYRFFDSPARALSASDEPAALAIVAVGENGGYAAGNNVGMRYALERAGADFVWILNSDVVVAPDALEKMLEVANSAQTIGIVGSKLLRFDEPQTIQALGGGHIVPVLCHDTQLNSGKPSSSSGTEPIELDHLVGASLLVRAEAIRDVGYIDESYFLYREETDWCIRMRRAGWQLYCCTQASVWHRQSHSIGFKSPVHDYYAVRNMLHLVRRFYPLAMPVAFSYFACRSIVPKLARLEFDRLGAVTAAIRDFAFGVSGRAQRHTDRVLMRHYVAPSPNPARHVRPAAGAALLSIALLFALMALRAALSPVAPATHAPAVAPYRAEVSAR